MPWSGGSFTRVHDWSADAAAGIDILASRMDAEDDNLAGGVNDCLHKGGQNSPTADLPMAGRRHTNVGQAASRIEYARADQVQDGDFSWGGTATGTGDAIVVTGVGGSVGFPAAYPAGGRVFFIASAKNTGPATLSVNGGTAKEIYADGAPLAADTIVAGELVAVIYDGIRWHLMAGAGGGGGGTFAPISCRVQLTADQTGIARVTPTTVVWDVAQWDDGSPAFFPVGNSDTLYIPETGRYRIESRLNPPGGLSVPENYVVFGNIIVNGNPLSGSDSLFAASAVTIASPILGTVAPAIEMELAATDQIKAQFTWDYDTSEGVFNWILDGNAAIGEGCWMVIRRTG